MTEDFYKSDELERDGFIHQDGSLRFEFEIIKKSYRTKNKELKIQNKELTAARRKNES